MDAPSRLAALVGLWWEASQEFVQALESLDDREWLAPTDLAGWDVHAVAAHIAHIESLLAGFPQRQVEFETPPHVTGPFGLFMESGVVARSEATPAALIAEIRDATATRNAALQADPPTDPRALPAVLPPGINWDVETLFNNRIVDLWMHQQDVRRAVGHPGGLRSTAADHSVRRLASSLGLVLAKRVSAPVGTAATFHIDDETVSVLVDEDGRGQFVAPVTSPTVSLTMTREEFAVAAGGRRTITPTVSGDTALAQRILENLAVTP